MSHDLDPTGTY
ncbi:uncharacterized protein Dsimw501_GD29419 [Drosophila simulans]|uniref:Peptide tarsal-less 3A n=2 Tax=melanogaster subgroup TaxID=32351 RepID=TAL3A_DROME|nr:tarsal-less 3A [Drosophila melanogaster]A3RLR0.1 RecName: Full=Peptide tarsal-less 3A; AltName: Full=Peptide polished rice 3 [Drosophila melanogaster]KMZ03706.1 uncharacterized protein Dsimw501_GD29419 [Drosophila simulans]KQS39107.1 uncharacterized protein Dere_GG26580 [Drosophila erecta]KRK03642.1 uncharacterized protein Dyak_GE27465 [Drosophila yakuba]ABO09843.1 tal3A [Drosophila melanogaster]ACL83510.1 tarsal-less 3A [Drosophila melanogaster]|eukprot:NP_001138052.1 tarsal-less 3A [Drosophila melanogaster]